MRELNPGAFPYGGLLKKAADRDGTLSLMGVLSKQSSLSIGRRKAIVAAIIEARISTFFSHLAVEAH
jgi:hypothetical protein